MENNSKASSSGVFSVEPDVILKRSQNIEFSLTMIFSYVKAIEDDFKSLEDEGIWSGPLSEKYYEIVREFFVGGFASEDTKKEYTNICGYNSFSQNILEYRDYLCNFLKMASSGYSETDKSIQKAVENTGESASQSSKKKESTTTSTTANENTNSTKTTTIDPNLATELDKELGQGFSAKVEQVAKNVNCDPNDLLAIMYSECGLDPSHVESSTSATGLVQFMPQTAASLGTSTEELQNMSAVDQLDYVEKYIINNSGKYKDQEKDAGTLYSIMFLPARADREILTSEGENYYKNNKALDTNNDGNITKTEMAERVDRKYAEMEQDFL